MSMSKLLDDFKHFRAFHPDLVEHFGDDLINAENDCPEVVFTSDVISAIQKYRSGEITQEELLNWVNILWFTEHLYRYDEEQCDSIASVMDKLEELDEEGIEYTDNDFSRMIEALENNIDYL